MLCLIMDMLGCKHDREAKSFCNVVWIITLNYMILDG